MVCLDLTLSWFSLFLCLTFLWNWTWWVGIWLLHLILIAFWRSFFDLVSCPLFFWWILLILRIIQTELKSFFLNNRSIRLIRIDNLISNIYIILLLNFSLLNLHSLSFSQILKKCRVVSLMIKVVLMRSLVRSYRLTSVSWLCLHLHWWGGWLQVRCTVIITVSIIKAKIVIIWKSAISIITSHNSI